MQQRYRAPCASSGCSENVYRLWEERKRRGHPLSSLLLIKYVGSVHGLLGREARSPLPAPGNVGMKAESSRHPRAGGNAVGEGREVVKEVVWVSWKEKLWEKRDRCRKRSGNVSFILSLKEVSNLYLENHFLTLPLHQSFNAFETVSFYMKNSKEYVILTTC